MALEPMGKISSKPDMVRAQYIELLVTYLSEEEVRELAFTLNIDWESLPGDGKRALLLSLILELRRRNQLDQLETLVREMRPGVAWPQFR